MSNDACSIFCGDAFVFLCLKVRLINEPVKLLNEPVIEFLFYLYQSSMVELFYQVLKSYVHVAVCLVVGRSGCLSVFLYVGLPVVCLSSVCLLSAYLSVCDKNLALSEYPAVV